MGQDTLSPRNPEGLFHRIIPEFHFRQLALEAGVFDPGVAGKGRRGGKVVKGGMVVSVAMACGDRRKRGSAPANRIAEEVHEPQEGASLVSVV